MSKKRLSSNGANAERDARIAKARAEVIQAVTSGRCPLCGAAVRRNWSLTGWWQCEQFGAEGFRKDSTKPSCNWQGFTS